LAKYVHPNGGMIEDPGIENGYGHKCNACICLWSSPNWHRVCPFCGSSDVTAGPCRVGYEKSQRLPTHLELAERYTFEDYLWDVHNEQTAPFVIWLEGKEEM
jgi:hypothetical protein